MTPRDAPEFQRLKPLSQIPAFPTPHRRVFLPSGGARRDERRREDHPSEDSGAPCAISLPERHCGEKFSPEVRASAAGDEFENALNLCMSHMAS